MYTAREEKKQVVGADTQWSDHNGYVSNYWTCDKTKRFILELGINYFMPVLFYIVWLVYIYTHINFSLVKILEIF